MKRFIIVLGQYMVCATFSSTHLIFRPQAHWLGGFVVVVVSCLKILSIFCDNC